MFHATTSALQSLPSLNFTPSLSVIVKVRLSASVSNFSASHGSYEPSSSCLPSCSRTGCAANQSPVEVDCGMKKVFWNCGIAIFKSPPSFRVPAGLLSADDSALAVVSPDALCCAVVSALSFADPPHPLSAPAHMDAAKNIDNTFLNFINCLLLFSPFSLNLLLSLAVGHLTDRYKNQLYKRYCLLIQETCNLMSVSDIL